MPDTTPTDLIPAARAAWAAERAVRYRDEEELVAVVEDIFESRSRPRTPPSPELLQEIDCAFEAEGLIGDGGLVDSALSPPAGCTAVVKEQGTAASQWFRLDGFPRGAARTVPRHAGLQARQEARNKHDRIR